jgi:hypothetical protein
MAKETRQVFCSILARIETDPDARQQEQWREMAEIALEPFIEQIETQFSALAQRAAKPFHTEREYRNLPRVIQLTFEAACRHLICLAQAVDSDDLNSVRSFDWKAWVNSKVTGPRSDETLSNEDEDDEEISTHEDED